MRFKSIYINKTIKILECFKSVGSRTMLTGSSTLSHTHTHKHFPNGHRHAKHKLTRHLPNGHRQSKTQTQTFCTPHATRATSHTHSTTIHNIAERYILFPSGQTSKHHFNYTIILHKPPIYREVHFISSRSHSPQFNIIQQNCTIS